MKVLIGGETSGAIRREFRRLGHDAYSCDVFPAEDGGEHIQADFLSHDVVNRGWDLGIFHPDCTFLTVSANAYADIEWRVEARLAAMHTVRAIWAFPIPKLAIENPVGVLSTFWRRPTQTVQPHEYGDDASKATCLWLRGLPNLTPMRGVLEPIQAAEPRMVNGLPRWANQTDSGQNRVAPSATRWMERARTYPGIARAMAEQWGGKLERNGNAA